MRHLVIVLLLLPRFVFAQQSCDDYVEVAEKIATLERNVYSARTNNVGYRALCRSLATESIGAALLLEDCFKKSHYEEGSELYVSSLFNLGYHYFQAESNEKARSY